MKKERDWKVTHHFANKPPEIEWFSRRSDAVRAVSQMESSDFNDEQFSEIENVRTGWKGKRSWGRRKILWDKVEPARGSFPSPLEKSGGLQLSLGVADPVINHDQARAEVDAAGVTK
jgi:hypothetical protein